VRTAVITVVSGRHDHLIRQQDGLARGPRPDHRVVVAIDDPAVEHALEPNPLPTTVVHRPTSALGLPLAAARNAGARVALADGAELLVFLDVDCIPGRGLLPRYHDAAADGRRSLLCGPVAYLPPRPAGGYRADALARAADPHPGRPSPADGEVIDSRDHTLFWSLSFAVVAHLWRELGGFCEDYTGYGGEDTDFGQVARAADVGVRWIGGATAFHQFHPVSDPPYEHLHDIMRNAAIFHRRWGWWPMTGWLTAFERDGLVRYDEELDLWVVVSD
jgi:GT2 family glycosyltransferase